MLPLLALLLLLLALALLVVVLLVLVPFCFTSPDPFPMLLPGGLASDSLLLRSFVAALVLHRRSRLTHS